MICRQHNLMCCGHLLFSTNTHVSSELPTGRGRPRDVHCEDRPGGGGGRTEQHRRVCDATRGQRVRGDQASTV